MAMYGATMWVIWQRRNNLCFPSSHASIDTTWLLAINKAKEIIINNSKNWIGVQLGVDTSQNVWYCQASCLKRNATWAYVEQSTPAHN